MAKSQEWILFPDAFQRGAHRGLDRVKLANALLAELKDPDSGMVARGRARILDFLFETRSEDAERLRARNELDRLRELLGDEPEAFLDEIDIEKRSSLVLRFAELRELAEGERKPVERAPVPVKHDVPAYFWCFFDTINPDCTCRWVEDDESPGEWAEVDWTMGTAGWLESFPDDRAWQTHWTFSSLEIEGHQLQAVLSRLAKGLERISREAIDKARLQFIANHSGAGGMDQAFREFDDNPALKDGTTQAEWRKEWRSIRGTRGPGAPKKARIRNP